MERERERDGEGGREEGTIVDEQKSLLVLRLGQRFDEEGRKERRRKEGRERSAKVACLSASLSVCLSVSPRPSVSAFAPREPDRINCDSVGRSVHPPSPFVYSAIRIVQCRLC